MSKKVQVIGNGPIGFTDSSGRQRFIPLSVLEFLDSGSIDATKWSLYSPNKDIVEALLKDLKDKGFLRPGPSPPAKPAMVLQAAVPGAAGNNIKVEFSDFKVDTTTTTPQTTFKATITSEDIIYERLSYKPRSPVFIKEILGTETLAGTRPCLIRVKQSETPSLPKKGSYPLKDGSDSAKSSTKDTIKDSNGQKAFTAEAWAIGEEGDKITVEISNVDPREGTFKLVVKLKPLIVPNITRVNLEKLLEGSGIVLKVTKPDGGNFDLPTPGTFRLSGGVDAKPAIFAASTTIVA